MLVSSISTMKSSMS
jgi:hypothetical protein